MGFAVKPGKKVYVDSSTCVSCGLCWSIAPQVFEQDPASGKVRARKQAHKHLDLARLAARACPTGSISVE